MNQLRADLALAQYHAPTGASRSGVFRSYGVCLLCHSGGPPQVLPDSVCATCGSPLAAPPATDNRTSEMLGRRGALRRGRDHVALVYVGWPSLPTPVRWRDLSLTGLSVLSEMPMEVDQMIRVSDNGVNVLAQVVDCRPLDRLHTVHARLLRARFVQTSGVFLSARV